MTLRGRGRALLEALLVEAGSASNGALAEALRMDLEDLWQSAADLCAQLAAMEARA